MAASEKEIATKKKIGELLKIDYTLSDEKFMQKVLHATKDKKNKEALEKVLIEIDSILNTNKIN
ncbi:MAG: hypothetical protein KF856_14290 [Cyclobacteriaceae bacterium]|nr:hypothetical protein [Cyclobacteriaceae bacterium]